MAGAFVKEAANGRMPASARVADGGPSVRPLDGSAAWPWTRDADAGVGAGAVDTWVDTDTEADVGSDGGLWEIED
jgi:hypothetical protein